MRKFIQDFSNRPYLLPALGIVAALIVLAALVQIPSMAKERLAENLAAAGFLSAEIGEISVRPSSVIAERIKLDQYGFDEIAMLKADINWLSFLFTGNISGLTIEGVKLGRDATNLGSGSRQLMQTLMDLPEYRITLSGLTLDITTDFGEIRLTAEAQVNSDGKPGRDIKAHVGAAQYQLGFDSTWTGTLKENGELDITATVEGGRLNAGPLRISRFNGWIGASAAAGKYQWQSQMESGGASFMDLPLQKLSLVSEYNDGRTSIIFRSGIAGMPDVQFAADMTKAEDADMFAAILSGNHLGNLLDYVEEATGRKKTIRDALLETEKFSLVMKFEEEKRFVGGPLPFSVALNADGKNTVTGNLLIYGDTLEVRGSLETQAEMAQALQDYFKIPAGSIRQNFIRLDGDLRRFFYLGPAPAEAANPQ